MVMLTAKLLIRDFLVGLRLILVFIMALRRIFAAVLKKDILCLKFQNVVS